MYCTRGVALLLAGTMLAFGAYAAEDETVSQNIKDAMLQARIETAYALNDSVDATDIDTKVENGHVVLNGRVDESIEKELAEQIAMSFDNVTKVENNLKIEPNHGEGARPEWVQRLDDATLNANVHRRLAYHSGLGTAKLNVDVAGSTVTVTGTVDSDDQRESVISVIEDTKGVTEVNDNITVAESGEEPAEDEADDESFWARTKATISDEYTEKRVETSLMLSRNVQLRHLDVEVEDGVCVLTGTAEREAEIDLAEKIAVNTQGVAKVVNEIKLM